MSERMDEVVARAVTDEEFRGRLFDDPAGTLSPFGLADDEVAQVMSALEDKFDGALEKRLSKRRIGKFGSLSGPMDIDGAVE